MDMHRDGQIMIRDPRDFSDTLETTLSIIRRKDQELLDAGGERQFQDRSDTLRIIVLCGLSVSLAYALVYSVLGLYSVSVFNLGFCLFYLCFVLMDEIDHLPAFLAKLLPTKTPKTLRVIAVLTLLGGLSQLLGTTIFFLPPATGSHYYLILIPVFALISIDAKDRVWWWFLTITSIVSLVYFEFVIRSYRAVIDLNLDANNFDGWRTLALLVTVCLSIAVFNSFYKDLQGAQKDLHSAFERSEMLLLNILPRTVVERLKTNPTTIADNFEASSVLFADLVGFTPLAEKMTANETVSMLNDIFSSFDQAVSAHGLEKIKTIGDAYMVAAGIPTPRDDHASATVALALEMLNLVRSHNSLEGTDLSIRIGINSGPLTAGVIGSQKFSYDVWGDTVNVASRMESTGMAGRIHVTQAVVDECGNGFRFEDRGLRFIKGKGEMRTYLLDASER